MGPKISVRTPDMAFLHRMCFQESLRCFFSFDGKPAVMSHELLSLTVQTMKAKMLMLASGNRYILKCLGLFEVGQISHLETRLLPLCSGRGCRPGRKRFGVAGSGAHANSLAATTMIRSDLSFQFHWRPGAAACRSRSDGPLLIMDRAP